MTKNTISILGSGWLGLPLAGHLVSLGFKVKGSFVSPEKQAELKRWKISPFKADFTDPASIPDKFLQSELLIVTVPPSKGGKEDYPKYLQEILHRAKTLGCKRVFFTSSTSVYPESKLPVNESSAVQLISTRGNHLLEAENVVRRLFPENSTVFRLGGLIGPGRYPGRFLSGKMDVQGGNVPVNYLSLEDAARMITEFIVIGKQGKLYNLVVPSHPSKEAFYGYACKIKDLTPPSFNSSCKDAGYKLVDGNLISTETGIDYLTTDWKAYLRSL